MPQLPPAKDGSSCFAASLTENCFHKPWTKKFLLLMKRRRTTVEEVPTVGGGSIIRTFSAKRPIDKAIISIANTAVTGTQVVTTLATITFPCTIVGLLWDISAGTSAGSSNGTAAWAIIVVRDGEAANTIALSNASTFYAPEQNVMAFGYTVLNTGQQAIHWNGKSKTGRKMMGGDLLQLIIVGEDTNTAEFRGAIQFFCKT